MRLWSLHPQHLDRAGLVALWREGLLAQAVLAGRTRGYTRHPQLDRFRQHETPEALIATYLAAVLEEAARRGYAFDGSKIPRERTAETALVTSGQLAFEWAHLKAKLRKRDPSAYRRLTSPSPHPCFTVVPGGIAAWERRRS